MALPKTFGAPTPQEGLPSLPGANQPRQERSAYENPGLPSLPEPEEDPFTAVDTGDPSFYSQDDIDGSFESLPGNFGNYPEQQGDYDGFSPRIQDSYSQRENQSSAQESQYRPTSSPMVVNNSHQRSEVESAIAKSQEEYKDNASEAFVDEKNKKLKPFGSGSKRKTKAAKKKESEIVDLKVNDFDSRKNIRNRNKMAVIFVIVGVVIVIALAGWKVFLGKSSLTADEVAQIAITSTGQTNFPLEAGASIAESFIEAYLTSGDDGTSEAILQSWYGVTSGGGVTTNRELKGRGYGQTVIAGPFVFEATPINDTSAHYVVGALVKGSLSGQEVEQNENGEITSTTDGTPIVPEAKWIYFNVNIYYDSEKSGFSITGDSPTVVPAPTVIAQENTPPSKPLGSGVVNDDLVETVTPIINGFLEKYAIASSENWKDLTNYTINPMPADLETGLDGKFTFNPDRTTITVYETATNESDPTAELKVMVQTVWEFAAVEGRTSDVGYSSVYVFTLEKRDGAYKISKMAPFYYVMAEAVS